MRIYLVLVEDKHPSEPPLESYAFRTKENAVGKASQLADARCSIQGGVIYKLIPGTIYSAMFQDRGDNMNGIPVEVG